MSCTSCKTQVKPKFKTLPNTKKHKISDATKQWIADDYNAQQNNSNMKKVAYVGGGLAVLGLMFWCR